MWPPARTAAALEEWAGRFEGRRTPAAKIHLTLAFLGAAAPEKALAAAGKVRGRRHEIPIDKAHYWRHTKILWVGPRTTPAALASLVEALQLELVRAEYILERRPYAAHVTLARSAAPPRELAPLPEVEWPVSEFSLVRSLTLSKASVYEIVARFPL